MNVIFTLSKENFLDRDKALLQPIDEVFMWLILLNRRGFDEATTYKNMK